MKLDAILQRPGIVPDLLTEAAALSGDLADVEVVVGADTQEGVAQAKAGLTELGEGAVIRDYEVQIALAQPLKVLTGGVPDLLDARFNRPPVIGDATAAGTEARLTDQPVRGQPLEPDVDPGVDLIGNVGGGPGGGAASVQGPDRFIGVQTGEDAIHVLPRLEQEPDELAFGHGPTGFGR